MYHLQFMVTCDVTDEASCALGTEVITRHLEGKQLIPKVRQRQSWWGWWYPETSTLGWQVSRGTKTHCQESHNLSRQQASYTTWREWQGIFKPAYKTCGYTIFLCQRKWSRTCPRKKLWPISPPNPFRGTFPHHASIMIISTGNCDGAPSNEGISTISSNVCF